MPKTIAITPSWYWPAGVQRLAGIPPFSVYELCVLRHDRDRPGATALIDFAGSLTYRELRAEVEARASALAFAAGESRKAVLCGEACRENVLQLLAALAGGVWLRLEEPGRDLRAAAQAWDAEAVAGEEPLEPATLPSAAAQALEPEALRRPAVTIDGPIAPVNHSHRSLLAMTISVSTFLDAGPARAWLSLLPLSDWEGLMAALSPLYLGAPLVLPPAGAPPDEILSSIARHDVAYTVARLDRLADATADAKRAAKDARRILAGALLAVPGPFDPDRRRRVSKSLECPALTFWGMPETGPVFASHPDWYIDEAIGIPITNAHVVPSDPRTGQPIQALWELVESAEVTVFSPSLMVGYEGDGAARFAGNRFRTGMIASSDANGMVYLLGEG